MNNSRPVKDVLDELMKESDISANELSRKTGVPQPTISRILNGESVNPANTSLGPLAAFFKISLAQMRGLAPISTGGINQTPATYAATPAPNGRRVPVINWIQAGHWAEVIDNISPGTADEWLDCPVPCSPSTFCLRVRGVSMEPKFQDNDYIFVDPTAEPRNNSFVIVLLAAEQQATFKQLIIEGERRYLKPLNPQWPEPIIEITGEATICGVVIFKGVRI